MVMEPHKLIAALFVQCNFNANLKLTSILSSSTLLCGAVAVTDAHICPHQPSGVPAIPVRPRHVLKSTQTLQILHGTIQLCTHTLVNDISRWIRLSALCASGRVSIAQQITRAIVS